MAGKRFRKKTSATAKFVRKLKTAITKTRPSRSTAIQRVPRSGMTNYYKTDPFPPKMFKALVYEGLMQMGTGTTVNSFPNAGTNQIIYLNSIWQPYPSAVYANMDTSALGVVELTPIYKRYKVMGVKVEVTFSAPYASGGGFPSEEGLMAGILIRNPSNTTATLNSQDIGQMSKLPYVWTKTIPSTGSQKCTFKQYFPMNQLFELTKRQYTDDIASTTGPMSGNPSTLISMEYNVSNTVTATNEYVTVNIRVTYYTQLYQRNLLAVTTPP